MTYEVGKAHSELDVAFFDYDDGVVTIRPSNKERWSASEAQNVMNLLIKGFKGYHMLMRGYHRDEVLRDLEG